MVNVKRNEEKKKSENYKHKLRDRTVSKNNFIRVHIGVSYNILWTFSEKRNNNFRNFFLCGDSNNVINKLSICVIGSHLYKLRKVNSN